MRNITFFDQGCDKTFFFHEESREKTQFFIIYLYHKDGSIAAVTFRSASEAKLMKEYSMRSTPSDPERLRITKTMIFKYHQNVAPYPKKVKNERGNRSTSH